MAPRGEEKKVKGPSKPRTGDTTPSHKPFNKHRKEEEKRQSPPAPQPEAAALLATTDDPDFPRGGRSLLSREEVAEARAEAEAEFEREERRGKRKRKSTDSFGGADGDNDLGSLFGDATTGKLPRFANRITVKNISPNMKLWGVVIEVNQKDIVISLPGGMRGSIRSEEAGGIALQKNNKDSESNILCGVVRVGQLVPCMVLRVDNDKKEGKVNRRVWLSLRLSLLYKGLSLDAIQDGMVLTAQVKSVEDHGYILHFGVSTFSGFMPNTDKG